MMRQPPDSGVADFTMFAAALMIIIGMSCLIATIPIKSRPPTEQLDRPQSDKLTPREARQRQWEWIQRWAKEDIAARAAGKSRPIMRERSSPKASDASPSPTHKTGVAYHHYSHGIFWLVAAICCFALAVYLINAGSLLGVLPLIAGAYFIGWKLPGRSRAVPATDEPPQQSGKPISQETRHSKVSIPPAVKPAQPPQLPVVRVRTDQINSNVELFWNYEFSLERKQRLAAIREVIADAYPVSQDDWEDGFRKDAAPEREIALWEHVTKFYSYFASKGVPTIEGRKELLSFLFQCAAGYEAGRAAKQHLKHIEAKLADTIQGCYIFDTFSLDDPVNYPPEEGDDQDDHPGPWLAGSNEPSRV
jgi:hypothetical protein